MAGGVIAAGGAIWGEKEQQKFNEVMAEWATKTDLDISETLGKLNEMLQLPTKANMALLIGEIIGDEMANAFLSKSGNQIPLILHNNTFAELEPFIEMKWLSIVNRKQLRNG